MPTKGTDKCLANRNPDRSCRLHVKDKARGKIKVVSNKKTIFNNLLPIESNAKSKPCTKIGNITCITLPKFIKFQQGVTKLW